MRYLVTGGAGFVGSHLAVRLRQLGGDVVALDDCSTGSEQNLAGCLADPAVSLVRGSVTDRRLVADLVGAVDAVFHLAAVVGVQRVVDRPRQTLRDNVLGARTVLDAAAAHGRPTLITSSSEVYGRARASWLAEDAEVALPASTAGRWAYAHSKLAAERHAATLHRSRGLPVVVARLFNTVGPGQSSRYGMVLPRFVEQALAGRDVTVHGDGRQSRSFCDVDDVVDALVGVLHTPAAAGEIINVGGRQPVTIAELAELVIAESGSASRVRLVPYHEAYGPGFEDVRRRAPDTAKIRRLVGWQPRRDLRATVRRVIDERRGVDAPGRSPRRVPADPVVDLAGDGAVDQLGGGAGAHVGVGGTRRRLAPDVEERGPAER